MVVNNLICYLFVRLFLIIFLLSLIGTIKINAFGFVWMGILGFIMLISSGWIVYIASRIIEKKFLYGLLLVTIACVVDFFVAMFLFNPKATNSHIVYALTCGISFIIVHNKVFSKNLF